VVDAEHLRARGSRGAHLALSACAVALSRPNGFSTMTRANVPSFSVDSPVAARFCRIAEYAARRRRQVEDAVAGGAALAVESARASPCSAGSRLLVAEVRLVERERIGVRVEAVAAGRRAAELCDASASSSRKSSSLQGRRAKPTTAKPGGSRPSLARPISDGTSLRW
jgi:hypothetical protein